LLRFSRRTIILEELRKIHTLIGDDKAEREAWDAHVDETLRRLRTLLEKAQAELDAKREHD
jgi:hypothetical protein